MFLLSLVYKIILGPSYFELISSFYDVLDVWIHEHMYNHTLSVFKYMTYV